MKRILAIALIVLALAGCSSTGCNTYNYTFNFGEGQESKVSGVDVRIVPVDKSTTGAVTSSQTTNPSAVVTGIPVS